MKKKEFYVRKSLWRRIFTPQRIAILGILAFIGLGIFTYYYIKFSQMIDAKLRGEVFVQATAIYAAPLQIRAGMQLSKDDLIRYLQRVGYIEDSRSGESKRGRIAVRGNDVEIAPSADASSDYQPVRISFAPGGRGVQRITILRSRQNVDACALEPEMLTSISNEKKQKRTLVEFKDLPKSLVDAIIAIEDRRFFEHSGIDFLRTLKAIWEDASAGEIRQGGSTLTQQLVKNFFLTPERTLRRKIPEIFIAILLETRLTKEQIFAMYCNEIFLGQQGNYSINGVGEAARVYFDKDVVNLTLPESAFLAAIIRGPSYYSPYTEKGRARAIARRNQVLDAMAALGLISPGEAEKAKKTDLKVLEKRTSINEDAPYFLDYLRTQVSESLLEAEGTGQSYRIYSTVDMQLQRIADSVVKNQLTELDKIFSKRKKNPIPPGTLQAALVALDARTGDILAMVGGRDYSQSQLNRATEANRQPGSVFKPIVYAAALNTAYDEQDDSPVITPASLFLDAPETFYYGGTQTYSPSNHGGHYSNKDVTLREALANSLNVVTVRVAEKVGYARIAKLAEKMGLPRQQGVPAIALGTFEATPLDVARAYTCFANAGVRLKPVALRRVTTTSGTVIAESKVEKTPVLTPEVAWIMTDLMKDVIDRGTGAGARARGFTAVAAGKTGTSHDGWFAGYTPNMICVVWVGFDDNRELGLTGAQSAVPIWAEFMKRALAIRPDLAGDDFPKPDGVVTVEIDPETGLLANETCPLRREEHFIAGTAPTELCTKSHESGLPRFSLPPLPIPDSSLPESTGRPRRVTRILRGIWDKVKGQ